MRKIQLLSFLFLSVLIASAQSNFRVMSYNLLNFPQGQMPSRIDTLEIILDAYRPDLFMIQELKSEAGLNQIEDALDNLGYANFAAAEFISQQSTPGTPNPLQQSLLFNQSKFGLKDQGYVITIHRDINYYRLFIKDSQLENGADTTFFYAVVCHLKSSEGNANEQDRLEMVESYMEWHNSLDENALVIFAGDYNVYYSAEPCYQALLSVANTPRFYDPISSPGSWNNNPGFSAIHTQCTRTNNIFNDGASGGMDDRFDQILMSEMFFDNASTLRYADDTYAAFGNSGDCFNENITDCNGGVLSDAVMSALYYMSDHLPVILELESDLSLSTQNLASASFEIRDAGVAGKFNVNSNGGMLNWTVYSYIGQELQRGSQLLNQGQESIQIPLNYLPIGTYVILFKQEEQYLGLKYLNTQTW